VILGDELWRRRFGADNNIIGQNIPINGTACTVVGIMPPGLNTLEPTMFLLRCR
jgi:hypothetical protein